MNRNKRPSHLDEYLAWGLGLATLGMVLYFPFWLIILIIVVMFSFLAAVHYAWG